VQGLLKAERVRAEPGRFLALPGLRAARPAAARPAAGKAETD
jgi:hypothetical protein